MNLCECGCGMEVSKVGNRFIRGHNNKYADPIPIPEPTLCACGCGEYAKPGNKYINSHNLFGRECSNETRKKMSDSSLGKSLSVEHRLALQKSKIGRKLPPFTDEHKKRISDSNMGKTFSEESCILMSAAKQGISVDDWKGFITSENDKFRTSPEYHTWRTSVFERDDYTCKECELRGGKLNAHHILPYNDWKEPRFSLNVKNGITLCEDCHRSIRGNEYEFFSKYFDIANGVGING